MRYCTEILGLPLGNKIQQQIDIPGWIKQKREFYIACIRGLVDTDGSIFTHRYRVNDKIYGYKKMAFTSRPPVLIKSVCEGFKLLGLKSRIAQSGRDVRIDSVSELKKYFQIINSHNPKHIKRYNNGLI